MAVQVGVMSRCCKSLDGLGYSQAGRSLKTWWYYSDFYENNVTAPNIWGAWAAGVGAAYGKTATVNTRIGIVSCSTGTTAAGTSGMYSDVASMIFGAGSYVFETEFYLYNLSTAIEEYMYLFGFGDLMNAEPNNGVYFKYNRVAGVNWFLSTADAGARTNTDSGIAVTAGAWIKLKVVVNATGTLASYYINEILVGTVNTNIPVAAGRTVGSLWNILKTVGITPRLFLVDWGWLHTDLAVTR